MELISEGHSCLIPHKITRETSKRFSNLGVQRRVHRPVKFTFPEDFPERLVRFKETSGMSWRSIAQHLGVSPYRLRQWRLKGVVPGAFHLFFVLTLAESLGLRDRVLMCPDRDLPDDLDATSR